MAGITGGMASTVIRKLMPASHSRSKRQEDASDTEQG
jgi:hypothetical protein